MRGRGWLLPAVCAFASLLLLVVSPLGSGLRLRVAGAVRPIRSVAARAVTWWTTRSNDGDLQDRLRAAMDRAALQEGIIAGQNHRIVELSRQLEATRVLGASLATHPPPVLYAPVLLSHDASSWRRSVLVDRGSDHGVAPGQPAVWQQNLVGRVREASGPLSRIQLTTDPGFRIAVLPVPALPADAAATSGRDVAVYEGTGEETGRLKWVSRNQAVQTGWYVVTAPDPLGGIPAGLLVGRLELSEEDRGFRARVRPLVRAHELEQVGILMTSPVPAPATAASGR